MNLYLLQKALEKVSRVKGYEEILLKSKEVPFGIEEMLSKINELVNIKNDGKVKKVLFDIEEEVYNKVKDRLKEEIQNIKEIRKVGKDERVEIEYIINKYPVIEEVLRSKKYLDLRKLVDGYEPKEFINRLYIDLSLAEDAESFITNYIFKIY